MPADADPPRILLSQGVWDQPPPPLAGALAAWVLRDGGECRVLDPRGSPLALPPPRSGEDRDRALLGALHPAAGWPLWAHLEREVGDRRLREIEALVAASDTPNPAAQLTLFGPGADDDSPAHARLRGLLEERGHPPVRWVRGDPEAALPCAPSCAPSLSDLAVLPLTTFAGFGPQPGGVFRLLAGRGDRARPVAAVLREVVYLVETRQLGHVQFDDADLSAYPGWLPRFEEELRYLPWRVSWEGNRTEPRRG